MIEFFTSAPASVVLTIVLSAGFGVFVRIASRNDRHSFVIGDFAVGIEILIALLTMLASMSVDYLMKTTRPMSTEVLICVYGLLGVLIVIWLVSTIIRKRGWNENNESDWLWGVMIPNLLSIYSMFFFLKVFNFLLR